MIIDQYFSEPNGRICFTREQGSNFAKQMANDFNPLHDADGTRFCIPGDLLFAIILANPVMIEAYGAGIPGNGKPFPDGARMAKIHWVPKGSEHFPNTTVPGDLHDVDFMVKDSKRFPDGGGWGYAAFNHDATSDTFTPATTADHPPQGNDAKCGVACHTKAKARDFVFTEYAKR